MPQSPLPGLFDFTQEVEFESPLGLGAQNVNFPPPEFQNPLGLNVGIPEIGITPGARATVGKQFDFARQQGTRNLLEAATTAAGRRGLQRTDTPVFEPFLRSQADLEGQLGSAEANSILGLSTDMRNFLQQQAVQRETALQGRFGLENQVGLGQENLLEQSRQARETAIQGRFAGRESALGARQGLFQNNQQFFNAQAINSEQFQERVRQQAFQNRLALTKLGADLGLGLAKLRAGAAGGNLSGAGSTNNKGLELFASGIDSFF